MKITTITVSQERLISLPGYNNFKVAVTAAATLEPDDDIHVAMHDLGVYAAAHAEAQCDALLERLDLPRRFAPAEEQEDETADARPWNTDDDEPPF